MLWGKKWFKKSIVLKKLLDYFKLYIFLNLVSRIGPQMLFFVMTRNYHKYSVNKFMVCNWMKRFEKRRMCPTLSAVILTSNFWSFILVRCLLVNLLRYILCTLQYLNTFSDTPFIIQLLLKELCNDHIYQFPNHHNLMLQLVDL